MNNNLLKANIHARTSTGRIIGDDCSPPEPLQNLSANASRPRSKYRSTAKKILVTYDWSITKEIYPSYLRQSY